MLPLLDLLSAFNFVIYNAATIAATTPTAPPIPASIVGAPPFEVEVEVEDPAALPVPDPPVVVNLVVVVVPGGLALVERAVLLWTMAVPLTTVPLTAIEVVEAVTVVLAGVLAGVEPAVPAPVARDAEYAEQRPRPTEAACWTSDALQAPSRQPVTRFWIFVWPEPHWQATSFSAQPEEAIADWRQGTAH